MSTTDPIDQGLEDRIDDWHDDWRDTEFQTRQCPKHPDVFVDVFSDCPKCLNEELCDEDDRLAEAWTSVGEPDQEPSYSEEAYQQHIASEGSEQWNANPDGCFFCGGDHHSDCCPDRY